MFHKILTFLAVISIFLIGCNDRDKKDPLEDLFTFLLLQNFLTPPAVNTSGISEYKPCSGDQSSLNDPLFKYQWHLKNSGNAQLSGTGSTAGSDAQVDGAWKAGCTGSGINIIVVDDGVDLRHEDLRINPTFNRDFTNQLSNHTQQGEDFASHGTSVAGVSSAIGNNNTGVVGAAWESNISSRNILVATGLSTNSPIAMSQDVVSAHISNNSWGAPDRTGNLNASLANQTWRDAIEEGLSNGRDNKGLLYFWAAGNGARLGADFPDLDNSNYDGQANFYGVMAIGAIGNNDKRALYSEQGANLWLTAHSEGPNEVKTITTDLTGTDGYNFGTTTPLIHGPEFNNNYTNKFNGTSSATPLVAGVSALILQANPNLSYRDVKLILAESARKVDSDDNNWRATGGKRNDGSDLEFNEKYGFGAVNAKKAVELAKSWQNVGGEVVSAKFTESPGTTINNYNGTLLQVVSRTLEATSTGISKIEFIEVELTVNSSGTTSGDLIVELESPDGKFTRLANNRPCMEDLNSSPKSVNCSAYNNWRFGVATFLNTAADGNWKLYIADAATGANPYNFNLGVVSNQANHGGNHSLTSWSIRFRGRAN